MQKALAYSAFWVYSNDVDKIQPNKLFLKRVTKMKKTLSLILALVMVFACVSLCACSNNSSKTDSTASTEKATLTMATNAQFPPYEYYEGDKIVGIDADIAQAIADDLGMKLEIADIEFDSIITGVQTGKYDMGMAGMTVTPDREKNVTFSSSYATGIQAVIVKEDSPIKSVDDILAEGATYTAGVQLTTTGDIYATDDLGENRVTSYSTGADAVLALTTGKVDCVIIDKEPAKEFVKANKGLKILDTDYVEENYAICFAKENTELKDKVNASLEKLISSGKVQEILDNYIKAE